MLINKPQFDKQELAPGTPIRVTASNWNAVNGSYAWPAIVLNFEPLKIKVVRVNPDADDFEPGYQDVETLSLDVDSVAAGHIKIEKLVPAKGDI